MLTILSKTCPPEIKHAKEWLAGTLPSMTQNAVHHSFTKRTDAQEMKLRHEAFWADTLAGSWARCGERSRLNLPRRVMRTPDGSSLQSVRLVKSSCPYKESFPLRRPLGSFPPSLLSTSKIITFAHPLLCSLLRAQNCRGKTYFCEQMTIRHESKRQIT